MRGSGLAFRPKEEDKGAGYGARAQWAFGSKRLLRRLLQKTNQLFKLGALFFRVAAGNRSLDAMLSVVHNLTFTEGGNVATFSIGTETVTGSAPVDVTGSSATFSLGDEDAFGGEFSGLIEFDLGSLDFFAWNETDDSQTADWTLVDPGSTN